MKNYNFNVAKKLNSLEKEFSFDKNNPGLILTILGKHFGKIFLTKKIWHKTEDWHFFLPKT